MSANPDTMETQWKGVYAGGDAIRGASTLIRAVRDGRKAADRILLQGGRGSRAAKTLKRKQLTLEDVQHRQARKIPSVGMPHPDGAPDFSLVHRRLTDSEAVAESSRCLQCSDICNICVGVCPNRAIVALPTTSFSVPVYDLESVGGVVNWRVRKRQDLVQAYQIINIPDYCNECGNCVSFCPSGGRPWADKPRVALSQAAFDEELDAILLRSTGLTAHGPSKEQITFDVVDEEAVYREGALSATFSWPAMKLRDAAMPEGLAVGLDRAADLAALYSLLQDHYLKDAVTEDQA